MKITAPGIFPNFDTAAYFADPTPAPSLTQSLAKILLDHSPRHAWCAHPRLNPNYEADDETKFDVGSTAHAMLIGRGKTVVPIEADDWRTKAAREAREEAGKQGKLAVLRHVWERAHMMTEAARYQLAAIPECDGAFTDGHGEVVAAAKIGPVWLRTMIDWAVNSTSLYDYKTTKRNAAPHLISGTMASAGWDVQAAMQETILDLVDPDNAGRRTFRFVFQEDYEPFALSVVELTEGVMEIGRQKVKRAIDVWGACIIADEWPAYSTGIQRPEYPSWAQTQWLNRAEESDDDV